MAAAALGLLCLLLALSTGGVSGKPAESVPVGVAGHSDAAQSHVVKRTNDINVYDYRWRMMSAMVALNRYSMYLKSYYEQSDLITLNTGHPKYEVLRNVLERVCDLVAFYELVAKVDSTTASTYLYPLLTATTNETCNWFTFMVANSDALNGSANLDMTGSCSPEGVTALHRYCYWAKAKHLQTFLHSNSVPDDMTNIHLSDMSSSNWNVWLDTTSLTSDEKYHIEQHSLVAILQYIINVIQ